MTVSRFTVGGELPRTVSTLQAARLLGVCRQRISQLIRAGRIVGAVKAYEGGPYMIPLGPDGRPEVVPGKPRGRPRASQLLTPQEPRSDAIDL